MKIEESDKCKMAFCTKYGHFEYQVMPFGLFTISASIQGYINKILAKKFDIFVVIYLNNILIYTKDSGQPHINAIY